MTEVNKGYTDGKLTNRACLGCKFYKLGCKSCGSIYSDHYGHVLAVYHPACVMFEEK